MSAFFLNSIFSGHMYLAKSMLLKEIGKEKELDSV